MLYQHYKLNLRQSPRLASGDVQLVGERNHDSLSVDSELGIVNTATSPHSMQLYGLRYSAGSDYGIRPIARLCSESLDGLSI